MKPLYRCVSCGHVCTEDEMDGDAMELGDGDEAWSNWVCTSCGTWTNSLEEGWEKVNQQALPDGNISQWTRKNPD